MKITEYNLPRVWTKEGHYYPVISELGTTYENLDKELSEENIKTLNWAFGWHFGTLVKDDNKKCGYRYEMNENCCVNYDYDIEQCSGIQDKNNKLIYENDIVIDNWNNKGIVFYSNHFCRWQILWYEGREDLLNHGGYGTEMFDWTYPESHLIVISNTHITTDDISNIKIIKGRL